MLRRAPAREFEQRAVLGDEPVGAHGERRFEEFLVVGVAAGGQARALGRGRGRLDARGDAPALRKRTLLLRVFQTAPAQGIGKHPREFRLADRVDADFDAPGALQSAHGLDAGVLEHQPIQPDVGVEDEPHGGAAIRWAGGPA